MRVTIWKNDKESNERAITRFNKKAQRKLFSIRGAKFHKKKPTRRQSRSAAVMRSKYRKIREKNKFY